MKARNFEKLEKAGSPVESSERAELWKYVGFLDQKDLLFVLAET